jgi:ACS family hexuronate transporter-like MFS transporter
MAASRPPSRRVLVGLLVVAAILNYADRQLIAILKPVLSADLHWTDADYGRMVSIFQLATALTYLVAGSAVDRLGLKRANPIAVGAWSLAALAHAFAATYGQFIAARIALGATETMFTPASVKTVAEEFPADERSVALGVINGANNVGAILTPLAVPFLAASVGWRGTFACVGALGLVWVAAWSVMTRGMAEPAASGLARQSMDWRRLFGERRTWAILGAKVLIDQVWWLMLFFVPDLLHRMFGLDMIGAAAPVAVIYGMAAAGSAAGGYYAGRLIARGASIGRARKQTMLICALLVLTLPLVLVVHHAWLAVLLLGLTLGAHQGFSVNVFAIMTDVFPGDRVGRIVSLGGFAGNLSGMAILQIAGALLTRGIGYGPLLAEASVAYLLALLLIHLLLPRIASVAAPVPA